MKSGHEGHREKQVRDEDMACNRGRMPAVSEMQPSCNVPTIAKRMALRAK